MKKIAIQGIKGSNHHIVANNYFGEDIILDECLSFDVLVDSLLNGKSEQAIMAIENTIAGSIMSSEVALVIRNYWSSRLNIHH